MQRLLLAVLASVACVAARAGDGGITDLSIEQLSNIQVTSVSKSGEALQNAPATIYVITHDDIVRSGVTSIAEALRLAPNLQITQYSSTNYVAGARGFAGAQEVQNFSNKLLILIDGRSVYTPIYSGVYLDAQDVALADIDRIEVISGPGATLWGANAMNGVINIITRAAYLTQGTMVDAGYGDAERTLTARYGAKAGDAWSWRVYGKTFEHDPLELRDGTSARDGWDKAQGGFRADWTSIADTVTTQGDGYRAFDQQAGTAKARVEGANLLARWQHRGTTEWQLQSYYDYTERAQPPGGVAFALRTYDVEWQQKVNATRQRIVWGAGGRMHQYYITPTQPLSFDPAERTLGLGDLFVSDTISLPAEVALTLGLKAERDPYSGWALLPDVRAGWHVAERQLVWASASRAIRSPTPFD
ncbi:MAG TPA: TonB-dependent receptor, partial [Nevskiaceae bacterium]|nr:TonB-dependent receptor [Nevskiaceae bacterium]